MDTALAIQIGIGVVIGLLGWSLRMNVAAFGRKLDGVAADVRAVALQASAHETRLAVLDTKIAAVEGRVSGLEDRERGP